MSINIRGYFFTETAKDTTIVLLSTSANVIAGGLFFLIVPRILGPAAYGLFSTVVATALMITSIANFGIDTGILRFASKNSKNFNSILILALKSYLIMGIVVSTAGILTSSLIADYLNQPSISPLLKIAFSSTIFLLLTNFFTAALQAKNEFFKASLINTSSNMSRLILVAFAIYFYKVDILILTLIFFFVPIISVVTGKILLPFKFENEDSSKFLIFHKYNFWIALSLIISSIPFDHYFLLKLTGATQTGIYAAPFKLLTVAYQFGGNFTRVLASRFSSFDNEKKAVEFVKKSIPFPVFFSLCLVLVNILNPILSKIFTEQFVGLPLILNVLSVGFIFFFLSTIPSSLILYYFGKSQISFWITALRYSVFIILLVIFVPSKAALGAAFAFTISELLSFLLMTSYVIYAFSSRK